jgi:hypothetical protein
MTKPELFRLDDPLRILLPYLDPVWPHLHLESLSLARVYEDARVDPALRAALERLPSPLKQLRLISPATYTECEIGRYGIQLFELGSLLESPPASLQHLERLILPQAFPLCDDCSVNHGHADLAAVVQRYGQLGIEIVREGGEGGRG